MSNNREIPQKNNQAFRIGLGLIVLGFVTLLGNLGWFNGTSGLIGASFLVVAGVLMSRIYQKNKKHSWALIVGFALFGAAAAAISGDLAGAYFLATLGVGFILLYVQNNKNWWAVIPAGVLLSLATLVYFEERFSYMDSSFILFAGIAATFGYLYIRPEGSKRWAIYPAIGAIVIAILSSSFTGDWLLPLLLIAAGTFILRRKPEAKDSAEPTMAALPSESE